MSQLNFTYNMYRDTAFNLKLHCENIHSSVDAFFLLINGMDYDSLSNLCDKIFENSYLLYGDIPVTKEYCYELTQNFDLCNGVKKIIYDLAQQCISEGMFLGNKMTGKYNTSAWISHSYYVGECCAKLASILGLDEDKARTYGYLHDFGRKKDHTLFHVIRGFEDLVTFGWEDEAISCLTHSFVNGGRCSNNECAVPGFYVDDEGNPRWKDDAIKDDITFFLKRYRYSDYDILLNIADLMATNDGIVSPYDRIKDIAARKVIDPANRAYFLADITNVFIDFLKRVNYIVDDVSYIKARKDVSLDQVENYFIEISQLFYEAYTKLSNSMVRKLTI